MSDVGIDDIGDSNPIIRMPHFLPTDIVPDAEITAKDASVP